DKLKLAINRGLSTKLLDGTNFETTRFISDASGIRITANNKQIKDIFCKKRTFSISISVSIAKFLKNLNISEGPFVYIVDRKRTRLNSSHVPISYGFFCLQENKNR